MNGINFVLHFIVGIVGWFAGALILIAGLDYFADGIELFSEPGKMVTNALIVFVVAAVVGILNFLSMFKNM
jgi:hypothetical protein